MSAPPIPPAEQPRHPIQVVAHRTGLSADVIRAWERRYRAVDPRRSDSGRRLYSDADIQRFILLREACRAGRRISEVARLSDAQLAELTAEDRAMAEQAGGTAERHYRACLAAIGGLDTEALHEALSRAATELSLPQLLDEVLAPLIAEVGARWSCGELRVYHEHFATAQLIAFLNGLLADRRAARGRPLLLATTPLGQGHELGALLVAICARIAGWATLYLAPNAPAAEIAAAARQSGARAVALSIAYPGSDPQLPAELRRLRERLPDEVLIIAGGRAAPSYRAVLDEIGALQPADLAALRQLLGGLA